MKEKVEQITSVFISIIILSCMIIFVFSDKIKVSEKENRFLKEVPKYSFDSLKSGKYIKGLEDYLSDHFPFRDNMLTIKTISYKIIGIKKINDIYLSKDDYLIKEFKSVKNKDKIILAINDFYNKLDKNKDVQILLVPTSTTIYSNKLPNYAITENEIEDINYIYSKLNIKTIDVVDELYKTKNSYYKLDHHWTTDGAYTAYLKYLSYNGLKGTNYQKEVVSDSFYGTFYSKVGDFSLKGDTITKYNYENKYKVYYKDTDSIMDTFYNEEYLNKKDKYAYFLNGNQSLIEITNESLNNDQSILVIKDSYANSFIPFITNNYKYTYVIDPRYYKGSIIDYIKNKKINKILFLYNIGTIDSDIGILSIY